MNKLNSGLVIIELTKVNPTYLESGHCAVSGSCSNCSSRYKLTSQRSSTHPPGPKSAAGIVRAALWAERKRGLDSDSFSIWI